ncbi:MAG: alcohol dehydrogenase catalytic domain-containing protein [Nocardioides sp.]|nr:alcohol dehydrogenase catalytic domain-containing protein [Nocardioides sp.]
MRALVLTAPYTSVVQEVPDPVPAAGDVVVDVARVGLCGTDTELLSGEMAYLEQGHAQYPMVLGHEWCGTVTATGPGANEAWLGRRVIGDTMLGCGHCHRCRRRRHHVCERRSEIGIRGSYPGALAERLRVPARALHALPDSVGDLAGAMVEPGGNALRALDAADLRTDERLLVVGTGTIGLLVAAFAAARGVQVHLAGLPGPTLELARALCLGSTSTLDDVPDTTFDDVIDASNGSGVPARAVDLVEPGGRVVLIGLSSTPSRLDSRTLVL